MTQALSVEPAHVHALDFDAFAASVRAYFRQVTDNGLANLFTTDAKGLWGLYLEGFTDPAERQHHNCRACRRFIEQYGGLVAITANGHIVPVMWDPDTTPEGYQSSVTALRAAVRRANVTGVFLAKETTLGTPETGEWRHLSAHRDPVHRFRHALLTPGQAMAAKRENHKDLEYALRSYSAPNLEALVQLLSSGALYRSEKHIGQAQWLLDLKKRRDAAFAPLKRNVVWRAVADAPEGFCHPRGGIVGTLLDDIARGKDFSQLARSHKAKMDATRYQRPQAAPTAGAIAAAERVFQQLNAAGSLERRFARLHEIQALWRPVSKDGPRGEGLFGHLLPREADSVSLRIPAQTLTWEKFQRTVLPTAEGIELLTPYAGSYTALVTAVNPDAPPILQWDTEEARNPVSWYFWTGGSTASQFCLPVGVYADVEAITLKPSMWNGGFEHHGKGVLFVLAGARETRQEGNALFPEILKGEFHGIRSVIEAYSQKAQIAGIREPHVAGLMVTDNKQDWGLPLRVRIGGRSQDYILDRWD